MTTPQHADAREPRLVIVFGAAGMFGRAVVSKLLDAGCCVRAFEKSADAWGALGDWFGGRPAEVELVVGDIISYADVQRAVDGCDAIVHTAVYFPPSANQHMSDYESQPGWSAQLADPDDADRHGAGLAWQVNVQGLYNVLEAARSRGVRRVVHLGSAHAEHPGGQFYDAHVRRPDGSLYAMTKRLQEEMCRQHHEAHGTRIVVLRPDYIVDSVLGIGRFLERLPGRFNAEAGWVCRHDLARAAVLALTRGGEFEVLHVVHTSAPGRRPPEQTCNVGRTRRELGWAPEAELHRYRPTDPPLVDCHCHAWPSATHLTQYPLLPGVAADMVRPASFDVAELRALLAAHGVSRCVLVGHNVFHGADSRYLLDAVREFPHTFRVTALLPDDTDDARLLLAEMRRLLPLGVTSFRIDPYRYGRACVERQRKEAWLHSCVWEEAARSKQALCCLIDPADLGEVSRMCAAHPATTVVVDHFARIGATSAAFDEEHVAALLRLAAHANVHVKLSAFYALGSATPPYEDIEPLIRRLLAAFGPSRLLWGSDCPYQVYTCEPRESGAAGTEPQRESCPSIAQVDKRYAASLERVRSLGLPPSELAAICGGNAQRLFFSHPLDWGADGAGGGDESGARGQKRERPCATAD